MELIFEGFGIELYADHQGSGEVEFFVCTAQNLRKNSQSTQNWPYIDQAVTDVTGADFRQCRIIWQSILNTARTCYRLGVDAGSL